jgi:hypothetical protein
MDGISESVRVKVCGLGWTHKDQRQLRLLGTDHPDTLKALQVVVGVEQERGESI